MSVKRALLGLSFVYFYSIAAGQEIGNRNFESDLTVHHDLQVFLDPERVEGDSYFFELNSRGRYE